MWCRIALHAVIVVAAVGGAVTRGHAASPEGTDHPATTDVVAQARPEIELDQVSARMTARVTPGQTVAVRVTGNDEIVGQFVRASALSITLSVRDELREIPAGIIQRVVLHHAGNHRLRGALIGALAGLLVGSSSSCYRVDKDGSHCGAGLLVGASVGGSLGAWIGSRMWRSEVIFVRHADVESAQAAMPPPTPKRSVPVDSLGALGTRLHPFDIVTVRTTAGTSVKGRFSYATDASVTLAFEQGARDIPVRDVLDVRRQNGRLAGRGAAIGFLFGAGLADLAVVSAGGDGETRVSENLIFGTCAGGGAGALWGALIGAFHHRQELVYRAPEPTVQLHPILGRSQSGVMLSMRF